ncbi:MAG TPA: MerR family transcriptional regulator [Kribbellaceae bacterium]|nr:MerR family transcriptional regulator [Kribbellaceae bacterium]
MWISELSRRTDVPVATIKYYLREGLLPPGEAAGATRAVYDDSHERRLRLIRALVTSGGLSLAAVREVLDALAHSERGMHYVLGTSHEALTPKAPQPTPGSRERVDALMAELGWQVYDDAPMRDVLASALDAMDAVGIELPNDVLTAYAEAAGRIGAAEVDALPDGDPAELVERAAVVTVLGEPVLLALRRLAQESASARRYLGDSWQPGPAPDDVPPPSPA